MRIAYRITALLLAAFSPVVFWAQPKTDPKMKKPKEFEERKLGSEKMAEKKFTPPRHFFQNLYTHYNYYFNANNKLNEIVGAAKQQHKEDYSKLLPFYNYSFEQTAQSSEIDSILEKCTAGILLHDLRNDWIDNLYLIMGRAYMLRKDFDSAAMTFQFINYTYSPKDKDGDDQLIASNRTEGSSAFSIATKEKRNIVQKVLTKAPSRNDAFVWMIRNYIENGEYIDASSLITTLRNDPNFPPRLKEELSEVEAYNYYKQEIYDSSANYLVKAVSLAENRTEKARWYYLIGQMYQQTGNNKQAAEYFTKCVNTATDPVMEVYARLSSIRLRKADDPKILQENIDEILKMARKEKYEPYQDIIYYAAALIELERAGYAMAETYLNKSVQYNTTDADQRSRSFLLLSDMLYDTKAYGRSGFFYDSVNTRSMDSIIAGRVTFRNPPTKNIYDDDRIIFAQDSLQKIAAMPESERAAYVKALAKRLRKERGIKEEVDLSNTGQAVNPFDIGKGSGTLFDADASKEFYFYNPQQRATGFNQFKQRWGSRPNQDNWRRSAAIQNSFNTKLGLQPVTTDLASAIPDDTKAAGKGGSGSAGPVDINDIYNPKDATFDALSTNLPTTQEQVSASNKIINEAMLSKGKALQNKIEDIPEAIKVYEALLARLSENDMSQEVMFNLIYCYNRIGEKAKATALKERLNREYKDGEFTKRANNPNLGTERSNPAATDAYKKIYNKFIEGDFQRAVTDKKLADSTYGNNYWNPQLLYIESVYYVKERQDSVAIQKLNVLAATYPTSPLAEKARHLAEVLSHRKEIEDRLTKLNITRLSDDDTIAIPPTPAIIVASNPTEPLKELNRDSMRLARDSALNKIKDAAAKEALAEAKKRREDSIKNATANLANANKARQDSIKNAAAQLAASQKAVRDSAKNAAATKLAAQKAAKDSIAAALANAKKLRDDSLKLSTANRLAAAKSAKDSALIVKAAADRARAYSLKDAAAAKLAAAKAKADSIKEATAAKLVADKLAKDSTRDALAATAKAKKDSIANAIVLKNQRRKDSIAAVLNAKRISDSLALVEARKPKPIEGFLVNTAEPQTVIILLNKVDQIYLNECLNAFNRYHQRIGGQLSTQKIKINNDYSIVQVNSPEFTNADAAYSYISKVKPKASAEIIPWLSADKFNFYIISNGNLDTLKQNQNVPGYLKALKQTMPNKF